MAPKKENNKKKTMKQRNWAFTLNNYDTKPEMGPLPIEVAESGALNGIIKYIIYGKEMGESGTPHLQGFVQFKSQINKPWLMKKLGKWASGDYSKWTKCVKSPQVNIDYCSKEGDIYEWGEKPLSNRERGKAGGDKMQAKWKEIGRLAKAENFEAIEDNFPKEYYTCRKYIHTIWTDERAKNVPDVRDGPLLNYWIVDKPRTGKSSAVHRKIPMELRYKKSQNRWWDGYKYEPYIVIEDFRPSWTGKDKLKVWTDRYSFIAEVKGGTMTVNPKEWIITSNYTIDDAGFSPEDALAMHGRFKEWNTEEFVEFYTMNAKEKDLPPTETREEQQTNVGKEIGTITYKDGVTGKMKYN